MKILVGLGNPGEEFLNTRHNAGFMFLDIYYNALKGIDELEVGNWEYDKYCDAEISTIKKGGGILMLLVKPQEYMNNSGDVIKSLYKQKRLDLQHDPLTVIHDDLDIQYGEYKVQMGIGPKGHKGILNINERLGTIQYNRIRLGVEAREHSNIPGEDYVLYKMSEEELVIMYEMIYKAISEFGLSQ